MKANTLLIGLLMLIAAGAVFASSWLYSTLPGQSYGSDTMPRFVGLLGLGVALALMARSIADGQRVPKAVVQDWASDPRRMGGMICVVLAVVAYIFFANVLGFIPIAFLLLLAMMLLGRTPLVTALIVSAVAAVAIQQMFGRVLLVPLPRSEFLAFLW